MSGPGLVRLIVICVSVLVAGCAPVRQGPLRPASAPSPGLYADRFESFDGARLGLSLWRPPGVTDEAALKVIVAVHGMNDYAGAFNAAGPWWAARGVVVYAYDQRGFGRSPRPGVWAHPDTLRKDLRTIVEAARRRHPQATIP